MSAKRIAGGAGNIEALMDFVSALNSGDARAADQALGAMKLRDNEFGSGYRRALVGMRTAHLEKNVDSLIYKSLKGGLLVRQRKELRNEFRARRQTPFVSETEKGYFAAWKDVLRIIDSLGKTA
jgi:hypothetical protein